MKFVVCLFVFMLCAWASGKPGEAGSYTTKYDNVDLDEIIKNDRLLRNYVDCLLGKTKCRKDGEELKKNLPEAIDNGCEKCSEKQRNGARKIIHHLIKNKRAWWEELEAIYDPQGTYRKKYEADAKKEGLELK